MFLYPLLILMLFQWLRAT